MTETNRMNGEMREIRWVPDWEYWNRPDIVGEVVWIDVAGAEAIWPRDYLYIAAGAPNHRQRYEQFGLWLTSASELVIMSDIALDDDGQLGFSDGRHRFAWMRDHGATALPVTASPSQAKLVRQAIGTRHRVCEVRWPLPE